MKVNMINPPTNSSKKKVVYCAMSADIIHPGHINILKIANKYGKVFVGLLTDKAIGEYKKPPIFNYNQRKTIVKSIRFVDKVIKQNSLSYVPNLKKIKPNYVIHGDDWKTGVQKKIRKDVIATLKKWKGKLIEPKYTSRISSSLVKKKVLNKWS